jgi:hypothetical protein
MKTLKLISAILLLTITLFSCSSDSDNNNSTCEDAAAATAAAAQAFNNSTDANRTALCNAYKDALQDQINACGDDSNTLQAIIDDLGDCTLTPANHGVISVVAGTLTKTFETNITVTTVGTTRQVRAEDNATSDWIYFEVQQGITGTDIISNFNIHLISSDYNPLADDEGGNWSSTITVNSATAINGTFFGYVTSPTTGADLELTSGVIDLDL